MNYNSAVKASETARTGYKEIKVTAKRGTSFAGIRKTAQIMRGAILAKREEVENQCKELINTYSNSVATPQVQELRTGFKNDVNMRKQQLSETLESITAGKRKAIERFTMTPPSDETFRLLNAYNGRNKDTVSDEEWNYLISAVGGNYLAFRMIQTLADKLGRTFVMPFTPEDSLKTLDKMDNIVTLAINSIDTPSSEIASTDVIRFFDYNGEDGRISDPYINGMIAELDSSAGTVVPEEYRSVGKRLIDAKELAYNKNNVSLAVKIGSFINKYSDQLQTPEELKEVIYQQAESLITEANTSNASDI